MPRPLLAWAILAATASASAQDFVPFVIPFRADERSLIAMPSQPIDAGSERLVARDGHFFRGGRRVRIWGVNLCFGANFPDHDAAALVARRNPALFAARFPRCRRC